MPEVPFVLSLDHPTYYGHDLFPNRLYRRSHPRHHDPLDMHTLGMIARLGVHAHHLGERRRNSELSTLAVGQPKDKSSIFEVHLDVGQFLPEELSVKLVNDCVVVEGKHEEREDDHGYITRHFVRRYALPKGYDAEAITSSLTSNGVLNVNVAPLVDEEKSKERIIPITQVGPSDLFLHNSKSDNKEEAKNEQ